MADFLDLLSPSMFRTIKTIKLFLKSIFLLSILK